MQTIAGAAAGMRIYDFTKTPRHDRILLWSAFTRRSMRCAWTALPGNVAANIQAEQMSTVALYGG